MPSRKILANSIRALSMDAVQKANSGHPGAPMGMADIAEVLWNDFLKHNPANPNWINRDRFILSNGHASMLLYSLLHLSGYDLPMSEIKNFRQLHSKTPGHPEYGMTPGVETTTGPLGQGLANAVGMAIAEKTLGAEFNREGFNVVDHYTYVFVGDGCLMEGISHEACSLAGTLGLGKLIVLYDDNNVSIDGTIENWYTENVPDRFKSYGWHVIADVNGHTPEAIASAIEAAQSETSKPTLICCKTLIGWGSPNKQGSAASHGAPLGVEEVQAVRATIGWDHAPFEIPEEIMQAWSATEKGHQAEQDWNNIFDAYEVKYPVAATEFKRRIEGTFKKTWQQKIADHISESNENAVDTASRSAFKLTLEACGTELPELIGGSADLSDSNKTLWSQSVPITNESAKGNYLYYGVREFAMSAIMSGIALHKGFIPYGGTFLMFSEYARNALRMASLMEIQAIFVYSHDSIGLGEDGPTHQAVEQIATIRYIPNMTVWRPCDTVEMATAWQAAVEHQSGPTTLVTSRQTLKHQSRTEEQLALISKGGYVLLEPAATPEAIIIATGSEVEIAMLAAEYLNGQGHNIRVVSMPSTTIFCQQDTEYQDSVLPPSVVKRVAVEAGVSDYWRKFVGLQGSVIGIDSFGVSAPAKDAFEHFGITTENVIETTLALLTKQN